MGQVLATSDLCVRRLARQRRRDAVRRASTRRFHRRLQIAFEYFNDTYAAPGCNELTVPPCYAYTQTGVGITNSTGAAAPDGLDRPALDVRRPAAALQPGRERQR